MSSPWTPLLPLALVGSERHNGALPVWPGELGQLIAEGFAAAGSPALGALRAAGVIAAGSAAGCLGRAWEQALPPAAPPETWPVLQQPELLRALPWLLREAPARLLLQFCGALAAAQQRLPEPTLPAALEAGRRALALRPRLLPVLGERGRWLAAQREDWRYASGVSDAVDPETRWSEGSLEQRRELLLRQRAEDPGAARGRLAAALGELPARERAQLTETLACGLSLEDEPLLEQLRSDRSREVRQTALTLLLRLPSAAHPRRAGARLAALLTQERILLKRRWVIEAPGAAGADWAADGIETTRPKHENLGDRGWWLFQLVRQVPLAWWTAHTGLSPAELNSWAERSDWGLALRRGWREVLQAAPEPGWCEAFLADWPKTWPEHERTQVLALLPLPQRERHWLQQLRAGTQPLTLLLSQLLMACPGEELLSLPLSQALASLLRDGAGSPALAQDWTLRQQLPELCCLLQPQVLHKLQALPRRADETPAQSEALNTLSQVLQIRLALHALQPAAPP